MNDPFLRRGIMTREVTPYHYGALAIGLSSTDHQNGAVLLNRQSFGLLSQNTFSHDPSGGGLPDGKK